jgi:hypothetical protein
MHAGLADALDQGDHGPSISNKAAILAALFVEGAAMPLQVAAAGRRAAVLLP